MVSDLLSLLIIASTGTLIASSAFHSPSHVRIDLTHPLSFYGLFFFIYYLCPYLLLFFSGQLAEENELTIALLLLLGYLAWHLGVKSSRVMEGRSITVEWLGKQESSVLLVFCVVGAGLVAYVYVWRVSHGIFFNQARYYEQDLTVAASFRDVFAMGLQLPLLLLLGLLAAVQYQSIASISHRLFLGYGTGIILILILSSQTRPAITALIFLLVGMKFSSKVAVRLYHLVLIVAFSVAVVLFVQGVRVAGLTEFASSDNQFVFAIQHAAPIAYSGVTESGAVVVERATRRAGAGMTFLSDVIDVINEGESHLYGEGILASLYSLVPRFLWPDKPAVAAPQIVAQQLLYMPISDDVPFGPITQFYLEGGWLGVIVGYWCFGWLMGKLTNLMLSSPSVIVLIIYSFVWGHVVNLELELVVGILDVLRSALVVYLLYWCVLSILGSRSTSVGRLSNHTSESI